jgi:hypothetical protein
MLDSYPIILDGKFLIVDFNDLRFNKVLSDTLDASEPPADYGSRILNEVLWESIRKNFTVVEIKRRSLEVCVNSGTLSPSDRPIKQVRVKVHTYGDWKLDCPTIERSYDSHDPHY